MFQVNMLPATFGDCFWVTYESAGKEHRILIDGGTAGTRNHIHKLIRSLPDDDRFIDLVVVSHIDNDHIAGILTMLQRAEVDVKIGDFWFNGRKHLPNDEALDDEEFLGSKQGEQLTDAIEEAEIPWNHAFGEDRVMVDDDRGLPVIDLPGGMKLTLLSPTLEALRDLRDDWDDELAEAGLLSSDPKLMDLEEAEDEEEEDDDMQFLSADLPDIAELAESDFGGDGSSANGSSIAFMLEFDGKRAVFAADAHAPQMLDAFNTLSPGGKLKVDFFKVSHHGSKGTTSIELIKKINCKRYAITTNGSNFQHPNQETIARILTTGGNNLKLLFNYRSKHNKIWDNEQLKDEHSYDAIYPESDKGGLIVDI